MVQHLSIKIVEVSLRSFLAEVMIDHFNLGVGHLEKLWQNLNHPFVIIL